MKRRLLVILSTVVCAVAYANVALACSWFWHQPDLPEALR